MLRSIARSSHHVAVPSARPAWHSPLMTHIGLVSSRGFCETIPPRAIRLAMPEFPEISHGNVGAWLVQPGDEVKLDQALVEIETADAVFDFEAPEDGFIAKICVPSHTRKVAVKQLLAVMVKDKESIDSAVKESENPEFESNASSKSQVTTSSTTTSTTTSTASSDGDPSPTTTATAGGEEEGEAPPASGSAAPSSSAAGGGQRRSYSTGSGGSGGAHSRPLSRGSPLRGVSFQPAAGRKTAPRSVTSSIGSQRSFSTAAATAIVTTDDGIPFLAPAARHLVIEHCIDPESLRSMAGSMKGGRISKWDILKGLAEKALKFMTPAAPPLPAMAEPVPSEPSAPVSVPAGSATGVPRPLGAVQSMAVTAATRLSTRRDDPRTAYEDIPLNDTQSSIASSLLHGKQTVPHAYAKDEVRMERLWRLRTEIADTKSVSLDIVDFVTRAVAAALNRSEVGRKVNAVWDETSKSVRRLASHSEVALSVGTGDGEVRPTVAGSSAAEGLIGIHERIQDLRSRALDGSLQPHEVSPAAPSAAAVLVSDLSSSAVTDFTSIVRPPHSCAITVSAPRISTVQTEGDLMRAAASGNNSSSNSSSMVFSGVVGLHMSWDSRVFDEAVAVEFLQRVRQHLEHPESLL